MQCVAARGFDGREDQPGDVQARTKAGLTTLTWRMNWERKPRWNWRRTGTYFYGQGQPPA